MYHPLDQMSGCRNRKMKLTKPKTTAGAIQRLPRALQTFFIVKLIEKQSHIFLEQISYRFSVTREEFYFESPNMPGWNL